MGVEADSRLLRAKSIAESDSLDCAVNEGRIARRLNITLSEAVVLGLLKQNVHYFYAVFGHGSIDLAEVLRFYQQAGLVKVLNVRNEIEASHAAAALRWVTGQKAAVITSIGPGALQALAASLVPASDGIGVWYIFGDETTEDEGFNMQQIPRNEQGLFLRLCAVMGQSYALHTPLAVSAALHRGQAVVDHPFRPGPFYLLLPMNIQPKVIEQFNLDELPAENKISLGVAGGDYKTAADWLIQSPRVVVRVGGGAVAAGEALIDLLKLSDGVAVLSPLISGVIPYSHPRNMTVGGSKGSMCGNYSMEKADLLVVIGSRSVCQSDCSRTGYPNVKRVININPDPETALHYNKTLALVGDARLTLLRLIEELRSRPSQTGHGESAWYKACKSRRKAWEAFKLKRYANPVIYDKVWKKKILTQPAVIKTASDWAKGRGIVKFFDAGDVQANGFQIVEDDKPGYTYTDTGASYMGFAVSAVLSTAAAEKSFYGLAFTGDGSFTMNSQVLIDGVEHGATGCILLLDNRRMSAISGLQQAQYGSDFATSDSVKVDYIKLAGSIKGVLALDGGTSPEQLIKALESAYAYKGLSLVYVPVYYGDDELGGMGVFGRWNVGNWCKSTQSLRHELGL